LEVKAEEAREKAKRFENAMEQNMEMQNLLRDELMKKSEEISWLKGPGSYCSATVPCTAPTMTTMTAPESIVSPELVHQ
ncbi:hypothetical protein QHH03_31930, partial [Aphanizomenon sp. 202]|nr:hypothetical protein [Aphanizomenon sp. 202]